MYFKKCDFERACRAARIVVILELELTSMHRAPQLPVQRFPSGRMFFDTGILVR